MDLFDTEIFSKKALESNGELRLEIVLNTANMSAFHDDIHNPFQKYKSSPPVKSSLVGESKTPKSRLEILNQRQSSSTPKSSSSTSSSSRQIYSTPSTSRSRRFSMSMPEVNPRNWWTAFGVCLCHVLCWLFDCCGQGRKCTRKQKAWWLVIVTFILTFLITIFVSIEMWNSGYEPHILAWFSGGMCVILAVPISVFEIFWHLVYFSNPSLQRYVIRILWMVPIYGIESWFALRYTENAVYLQAFREFYEAYVIWSFLHFLMSFLGDQEADIVDLLQRKAQLLAVKDRYIPKKHIPPFCCLKPWKLGKPFFYSCKLGVLQYVIIKIFTTTITVICVNKNIYGEGEFTIFRAYPYIAFIDNWSQLWALYCLAIFYTGLKKELQPIKPFSKFLSVKAIVFFSWWQGFFIQIAVSTGYITHTAFYTKDNVARALQNWLVCIEMLVFAICHKYAFSYKEFVDVRERNSKDFITALFDSTIPVDFIMDMRTFTHTFESLPSNDVVDGSINSSDEDEDDVFNSSLNENEDRLERMERSFSFSNSKESDSNESAVSPKEVKEIQSKLSMDTLSGDFKFQKDSGFDEEEAL